MKKHRTSLILLGLLVSVLFLGFISGVGGASSDIDYTFQNDNLYNSTSLVFDDDFNVRDADHYEIGFYNATYSFTNDTIGSEPLGWVSNNDIDCTTTIINQLEGHNNVLKLNDSNNSGSSEISNTFSARIVGDIEWWQYSSNVAERFQILMNDVSSTTGIALRLVSGNYQSIDGAGDPIASTISANTWYHHRIDFDCVADTFDWYINGILELDDTPYLNVVAEISSVNFGSYGPSTDYYTYFDGIGHSWDSFYEVNDNFFPFVNTSSNAIEVDRWEFSFSSFQVQYVVGSDVFSDWDEIEAGHDYVNIDTDPIYNGRRRIKIINTAPNGDDVGIEREFDINTGILNISWGIEFTDLGTLNDFDTFIYSSDDTLIAHLYCVNTFLRGTDDSGLYELYTSITDGEFYEFNWYINCNDAISVLRFYIDGVYEDTYYINLIDSSKEGLGKITHQRNGGAADFEGHLSYTGVYLNGSSVCTEFAYVQYEDILGVGENYWYFQENNIFTFNATGTFSIYVSDTAYVPFIGSVEEITHYLGFYNGSIVANVYDLIVGGDRFEREPMIWFQFFETLEVNSISIDGVILTDGISEHHLEFSHGNVDINESYFYVSGISLYYSLDTNQNDLEYIQASFNINNLITENYSVSFHSNVFGASSGNLRMNYTDSTSSFFEFPSHATHTSIILPQEREIGDIIVLITDNDLISVGSTTGYIKEISFINFRDITITIITFSLLLVLIPLIIMIVPTFAMYGKFGRSAVLPMFILMSVVCFATNLIPIWLFFLIMIGCGVLLIRERKMQGDGF